MNKLTKRLDPRLDAIDVFRDLTQAETKELELLAKELAELESNMSLSGTTASEIARREAWFGVSGNEKKALETRRSVLVARLRGQGTTTPELIKQVALSFSYGDIDIDETSADYTVNVTFSNVLGVPVDIAAFKDAVQEVAPAHLVLNFIYTHNSWDMLEAFGKTWDAWETLKLGFDEMMDYSD